MCKTVLSKNDMDALDAFIMDALKAKQDAIGTTDTALGEQAFPWIGSPIMKIQGLKGKGGKKPQQLRFADIINLCEALGLPWGDVCRDAVRSVKKNAKMQRENLDE